MRTYALPMTCILALIVVLALPHGARAADQGTQPNIVFIMADDVGWFNIGAYHRGIMAGKTPSLDKLANEGMLFTDYYAEASCTAGRANFITGELPVRTGLTTVGQAGSPLGMPAEAPTIATVLKSLGYATGQFGKNHLGDLNKFLPTVHGFDEFFGYLYHLDAMEDPFWHSYPPELAKEIGPRNLIHSFATDTDDPAEQPRWGKIGKQKIVDEGPLPPHPMEGIKYNMETVDEDIRDFAFSFMDKAHKDGKPFFVWLNPTRMHVFTHLSEAYAKMQTPKNGWYTEEAGMAQLDDIVGDVMKKLADMGLADNTIVVFTTDNGAEVFSWPDGGMTPFRGSKGMVTEGGFRVPAIIRWPGKVPQGAVANGIISGLDWFPTLVAAAGYQGDIVADLKKGKGFGGTTYKVHLDGYDQTPMLTGQGDSQRHELYYFAEMNLGAVRVDDYKYIFLNQPDGWFGPKQHLDWPQIVNLRLDPFELTPDPKDVPPALFQFYAHEFWRFVYAQRKVGELAKTALEFPPMQKGASFNLEAVKQKIEAAMASRSGE